MSSSAKDTMGNKESLKQQNSGAGDTSSTSDVDTLKPTALSSVRGLDSYKLNIQGIQNPNTSSQVKGYVQAVQNDRKKVEEDYSQPSTTVSVVQPPTTLSLPNTFSQDMVTQARENFLQSYASMHQPMFTTAAYANGSTVFSGQMIPPMLVQQPMQVPAPMPGMFQTGFMYQTLTQGATKPNHANSNFFPPFKKGSLIMLATGTLKPIEDLKTVDFVESAKVSKQLCLETSKIAKIQDLPNSTISLIGFAVDNYEREVLVEKPSDHPFFIYEQGWASCKPDITLSRYGLPCQQLKIGDVCVFLSDKVDASSERSGESEVKPVIEEDRQFPFGQNNAVITSQSGRSHESTKVTETESISSNTSPKTQPKMFGKKDNDEAQGFGQPSVKKAKLDVASKNADTVKS